MRQVNNITKENLKRTLKKYLSQEKKDKHITRHTETHKFKGSQDEIEELISLFEKLKIFFYFKI